MNLIVAKILVAILLSVIRFAFVYVPIKIYNVINKPHAGKKFDQFTLLTREKRFSFYMTIFHSFGAGVMLCTCLIHLMWEVHVAVDGRSSGRLASFSQLLICIGFFLIYFAEEFSQWILTKVPSKPLKYSSKSTSSVCEVLISSIKRHISHCSKCTPIEAQRLESIQDDSYSESEGSTNMTIVLNKRELVKFLFTEAAIALHAIFEGLAIGLQCEEMNIWYLSIGMTIHSATTLLYVGLNLIVTRTSKRVIIGHFLFLAFTNPCGIILGLLISLRSNLDFEEKELINGYMEALSAGTILYITFFDVLSKEKRKRVHRISRGLSMMMGFGLMCYLEYYAFNEDQIVHTKH